MMKRIAYICAFIIVLASMQCCTGGASWGMHETSPVGFSGQKVDHYFVSVGVDWSDGVFNDINRKRIRIYIADDRLDSSGLRIGELLKDSWEMDAGALTPKISWKDDLLTIQIIEERNGKPNIMTKKYQVKGQVVTIIR